MKVFFFLFTAFILLSDFCISARPRTVMYSDEPNKLPKEFVKISPLAKILIKDTTPLGKEKSNNEIKNFLLLLKAVYDIYKGISNQFTNGNIKQHRNTNMASGFPDFNSEINPDNVRNNEVVIRQLIRDRKDLPIFSPDVLDENSKWPEIRQNLRLRKRNAFGMDNNIKKKIFKAKQKNTNKIYDDTQDDYNEDDEYFKDTDKERMNWEEYQNEDGASVMELIALNARHKTSMEQPR